MSNALETLFLFELNFHLWMQTDMATETGWVMVAQVLAGRSQSCLLSGPRLSTPLVHKKKCGVLVRLLNLTCSNSFSQHAS
jgi:hypothetical protein